MKLKKIFILALIYSSTGFSQISACFIDSVTNLKIPYVLIKVGTFVGFTDSMGKIEISSFSKSDTILVERLGYKTRRINNVKLKENNFFKLQVDTTCLPEVIITNKKSKVITAEETKRALGYFISKGSYYQVAKKFILDKNAINGAKINSISFYISNQGSYKTKYRAKIYFHDSINDCPGEYLLKQDIIVSANKKNNWHEVVLDSLNMKINTGVIYVAMEWLNIDKENYFSKIKGMPCENCYGQVLGLSNELKNNEYFIRKDDLKWVKINSGENNFGQPVTSPMIDVKYTIYE